MSQMRSTSDTALLKLNPDDFGKSVYRSDSPQHTKHRNSHVKISSRPRSIANLQSSQQRNQLLLCAGITFNVLLGCLDGAMASQQLNVAK